MTRRRFRASRCRTACGLALVVAGAAAGPRAATLTAAEIPRTVVTVRVYDAADLSSTLEQRALTEAATILSAALVEVDWRRCSGRAPSAGCDAPPGSSDLSLRILRSEAAQHEPSSSLGAAFVDPHVGGVLATVYATPVAQLARVTRTDAGVLLGRVAAHELGHLLMRTTVHPRLGLMRADWTRDELWRDRAADWTFTAEDVMAMRRPSSILTSAER